MKLSPGTRVNVARKTWELYYTAGYVQVFTTRIRKNLVLKYYTLRVVHAHQYNDEGIVNYKVKPFNIRASVFIFNI